MRGLIGHTGFVGGNLATQMQFDAFFNSKNIAGIENKEFSTLYVAGVYSKKWIANQQPEHDFEGIRKLRNHLSKAKADRVVLVSTVDVYDPPQGADEGSPIAPDIHPYGKNRYWLEQELRALFQKVHVVRLPGLFGEHLQKNAIYDLMHGNCLHLFNLDSSFQWYDLARLTNDLGVVVEHDLDLVNLCPEPIVNRQWVAECFPELIDKLPADKGKAATYDIKTRSASFFGGNRGYIENQEQTIDRIKNFVESHRA